MSEGTSNYDTAASYANSSASGNYSDGFHAATQAYATLALVDAVKELTEAVKANRPPRTVSGLPR